jgi:hypothetical protein
MNVVAEPLRLDALAAMPKHMTLYVDVRVRNLWRVKLAAVLIALAGMLLRCSRFDLVAGEPPSPKADAAAG